MESEHDISEMSSPREDERPIRTSPTSPASSSVPHPETTLDRTGSGPISTDGEKLDANQEHLLYAFGHLSVRKDLPMAERMFALLEDVFQSAVETNKIDLGLPDWHNRLRRAEENSRRGNRDIEILKWVRTILDRLRLPGSEDLTQAANILADGSRDGTYI